MPKPTERALRRKPMAMVLLQRALQDGDLFDTERDFEWFENADAMAEFFAEITAFYDRDWEQDADTAYVVLTFPDTGDLTKIGQRHVVPSDNVEVKAWAKAVFADPALALEPKVEAATKKAAVVRSRKASKAALAAMEGKTGTGPAPRRAVARAATKALTKSETPTVRAAGLKARLAEKRAALGTATAG